MMRRMRVKKEKIESTGWKEREKWEYRMKEMREQKEKNEK